MSEIVITSVAEFQARLQELGPDEGGFLYRGQADAIWPVSCSAARRLTQDPTNPIEDQLINSLLVGYLEYLIAKARMRGFLPPGFSETSPDLELLAQLQHQGAATGLIDFTRQPSVALWMACNEAYEIDGAVYVLSRSATEEISNSRDLEKQIQWFYGEDLLWSWEPSARGNRIVAQSSVLVFGVPTIASHRMERFIIRAGSKREVLTQLETVYGINEEMLFPDFPGFAIANSHNKTFDIRRAVSYWREQVKLELNESARALAHYNCGVAYSAVQEFQNATEQYSEAINLFPEFASAYTNRGTCRACLGRHAEAIADFDKAICIEPENYKAYDARAGSKATLDRYSEATADFDEAIGINPVYVEGYINRGAAKAERGRYAEAIADYDEALRIKPGFAEAYYNRGCARAEVGQYAEAIADYDEALRINPRYTESYINRGAAKTRLGQYVEAIADYDEALRIDPGFVEGYINRGAAKAGLGRHMEAIADYDEAIHINKGNAEVYNNRGMAKAKLEQYAEAIADYDEAIHIDPRLAETYYNRGNLKAGRGCHAEAIADYDEAIHFNSGHAEAYFCRGNLKTERGRHAEAIVDYDEAIRINPTFIEAYANRGLTKRALREFSDARKDFERAETLAQEQGRIDLLQRIKQELDDLKDSTNTPPFQVAPHSSGYVPGVDPEMLKEMLGDLDDERFTGKGAT